MKRLKYHYPTLITPSSTAVQPLSPTSVAAVEKAFGDYELEFQKEIRLMSKLRHPNVIEFVGAVATPGHLAIVSTHVAMMSHSF